MCDNTGKLKHHIFSQRTTEKGVVGTIGGKETQRETGDGQRAPILVYKVRLAPELHMYGTELLIGVYPK